MVEELRRENSVLQHLVTSRADNQDIARTMQRTRDIIADVPSGKVVHHSEGSQSARGVSSSSSSSISTTSASRRRLVAGNHPFGFVDDTSRSVLPTLRGISVDDTNNRLYHSIYGVGTDPSPPLLAADMLQRYMLSRAHESGANRNKISLHGVSAMGGSESQSARESPAKAGLRRRQQRNEIKRMERKQQLSTSSSPRKPLVAAATAILATEPMAVTITTEQPTHDGVTTTNGRISTTSSVSSDTLASSWRGPAATMTTQAAGWTQSLTGRPRPPMPPSMPWMDTIPTTTPMLPIDTPGSIISSISSSSSTTRSSISPSLTITIDGTTSGLQGGSITPTMPDDFIASPLPPASSLARAAAIASGDIPPPLPQPLRDIPPVVATPPAAAAAAAPTTASHGPTH
jgi:hypothetical protein